MELCEFRFDGLAEFGDLFLIAHIDGDRHSSTAAPVPIGVPPGVVIQVVRGTLVSAANIDKVAQVHRSACRGCSHYAVADGLGIFELSRRSEDNFALTRLEHAA